MKNKSLVYLIFKSLLLIFVFCFLVVKIEFLFKRDNPSTNTWDVFYKQKPNTADFLFFGNSHIGNGLDLNIINSKTKAKVFTLYGYGQTLPQVYYNVKEALKYQTPKLIVLETYSISNFSENHFNKQKRIPKINSFDAKNFDFVKVEEFLDLYKDEGIYNFSPLITNHFSWSKKDFIKNNLNKKLNSKAYFLGNLKSTHILNKAKINLYREKDFGNSIFKISEHQLSYFNKIVDLAKEKNIQVMLVTIPYFKEYRNKINYESIHKSMIDLATKNEFKYLDLNKVFPNMEYNCFMDDKVRTNQHLNYKGNILVSNYLADYISEHYSFKLNKGNKAFPEYYLYNKIKSDSLNDGSLIIGNLDRINGIKTNNLSIKQEEKSDLKLSGWIAVENHRSEFIEMFIALVKNDNFIYVSQPNQLNIKKRLDVTKNLKQVNNLYDDSGFDVNINSLLLEKGQYKIYLIIRTPEGEIAIKNSGKKVEII
ncbi:hypothetical protein [Thalassobellus suaedae]|uniref:AlgX/AlgJ SGNH hydrolase-like domain-containing protein n=1 Tax=Thalassobellus suaedae TaxID=3074124 RepID=A0ABY9XRR3_9FLAO|nr:hypothetical protein RHP51_16180 [Flavobacteriaceae bacterium HL-DH14]